METPAPKRPISNYVAAGFGAFLMLISAPCVVGMIHDVVTGADNLAGALIAGTFFSFLGVIGLAMTWWALKKPKKRPFVLTPDREHKLLNLARAHDGVLTASLLAAESPLTLHEARKSLEMLEVGGFCHSIVTAAGGIAYHFPDLMPGGTRTQDDVRFDFDDEDVAAPSKQPAESKHSEW